MQLLANIQYHKFKIKIIKSWTYSMNKYVFTYKGSFQFFGLL